MHSKRTTFRFPKFGADPPFRQTLLNKPWLLSWFGTESRSTIDMLGRAIGIIDKNMRATGFVQSDNKEDISALNEILVASSIATDDKNSLAASAATRPSMPASSLCDQICIV